MTQNERGCARCNATVGIDTPHIVQSTQSGDIYLYCWECGEAAYAAWIGGREGARWLSRRRLLTQQPLRLWED